MGFMHFHRDYDGTEHIAYKEEAATGELEARTSAECAVSTHRRRKYAAT